MHNFLFFLNLSALFDSIIALKELHSLHQGTQYNYLQWFVFLSTMYYSYDWSFYNIYCDILSL